MEHRKSRQCAVSCSVRLVVKHTATNRTLPLKNLRPNKIRETQAPYSKSNRRSYALSLDEPEHQIYCSDFLSSVT